MDYKKTLLLILSILFSVVLFGCGSGDEDTSATASDSDGESVTIQIGYGMPPDSSVGIPIAKFADKVHERTDGKVNFEIFDSGQLGDERSMMEQVQTGSLDMVAGATAPLSNFIPEIGVMDMPFLFRDYEHVHTAIDGEFGEAIAEKSEDAGFKFIAFLEMGFSYISNSEREIRTIEDLEGLQIRTKESNTIIDTFNSLGANPTAMAYSEVYTAAQQGVIEGIEAAYVSFGDAKFYEVQQYLSEIPVSYGASSLTMNLDLFNSLDPETQEIILEEGKNFVEHQREINAEVEAQSKQDSLDNGVNIVETAEIDLEPFIEAVEPVYDNYPEFDEMVELIRSVE